MDRTNRWVVLGDTLSWAELEKVYNSRLNNSTKGAGNKPARMVIGAMIVKHKLNLSNEDTIQIIRETPYMQYMCGLKELTDMPLFDTSLFVYIRKRITEKEINEMSLHLLEEEQRRKAMTESRKDDGPQGDAGGAGDSKGTEDREDNGAEDFGKEFTDSKGHLHKGVLKIDATCANAEVRYPVDIDIVHDGCKMVNRYVGRVCGALGIRKPHTSYTAARRAYLKLVKKKKRYGRLMRQTIDYMLQCLGQDLRLIVEIFVENQGSKSLLSRHDQTVLNASFDMYAQ